MSPTHARGTAQSGNAEADIKGPRMLLFMRNSLVISHQSTFTQHERNESPFKRELVIALLKCRRESRGITSVYWAAQPKGDWHLPPGHTCNDASKKAKALTVTVK